MNDTSPSALMKESEKRIQEGNIPEAIALLHKGAEQCDTSCIRLYIRLCKKNKNRAYRFQADRYMLLAYGMGLHGYEYQVSQMLYEGLGYYSRIPMRHTNQKRAVQILLYEKSSSKRSLTLGRYLLDSKKEFCFHNKKDALSYSPPKPIFNSRIPYSPNEAIQWLERADCMEGYAKISQYYWEIKETSPAIHYYQKAKEKLHKRKPPKDFLVLENELCAYLATRSPEEKLSFLFHSEDPHYRLQVLKKALWAVTSEGYCRIMSETLERGDYDPEAEEWKTLIPFKEEIQLLYDKYSKICNNDT